MGYGADEIYTRSALRSQQLWRELAGQTGEELLHETGVLWLAHEDDPYPGQTAETLLRAGVEFERLSLPELAARYPQLGRDGIAWAMLEPHSGVLMARRAVQAVARQAIKAGVEYLQATCVAPTGRGAFVFTDGGQSISASNFVFACGPWLPKIFPELLQGRIRPTRQEVFYFACPAAESLNLPTWIDFKDELYCLPDVGGHGVKVAIDRHGESFDPDMGDRNATGAGQAEVRRRLARRLPALQHAVLKEARVCQYENTANGDFLIDRHPEFHNVWLVGGGSGHGFKHGPAVGEYVAARIAGISEGIEPRFSLASKAKGERRAVY